MITEEEGMCSNGRNVYIRDVIGTTKHLVYQQWDLK